MYHIVEFRVSGLAELDTPGDQRSLQVFIKKGTRVRAEVKPYVVESDHGPVEVADLWAEDGTSARAVRFAAIRFIDE